MTDKILMPKELTAENGAKYLLSGEFRESIILQCEDCNGTGEDEHSNDQTCESCSGSGDYNQAVTVSWTTIKKIYKMSAEFLGEEVKNT